MNAKSAVGGFDSKLYAQDDKSEFLDYIPDEATD